MRFEATRDTISGVFSLETHSHCILDEINYFILINYCEFLVAMSGPTRLCGCKVSISQTVSHPVHLAGELEYSSLLSGRLNSTAGRLGLQENLLLLLLSSFFFLSSCNISHGHHFFFFFFYMA